MYLYMFRRRLSLLFMEAKTSTQKKCIYCNGGIDTGEPGWGYNLPGEYFHTECFQMVEGIAL